MATALRRTVQASVEAEDKIRTEISELFLLLKSGKLSGEQESALKKYIDLLIAETKKKHDENESCCGY
jgi:hypothetical protein